jgi:hypothetical protein
VIEDLARIQEPNVIVDDVAFIHPIRWRLGGKSKRIRKRYYLRLMRRVTAPEGTGSGSVSCTCFCTRPDEDLAPARKRSTLNENLQALEVAHNRLDRRHQPYC